MAPSSVGPYDVGFKPKLLRSLLRDRVPDEKRPFKNPSDLAFVAKQVETHGLLYECAVDPKLAGTWKSAVDAWVSHLTALASSQTPDKVWAAMCLLGLTCQGCNSERFLASYKQWFDSIFTHIQSDSGSQYVRVASLASMSDLLTRLARFPSEKKDGTSLATKLVRPVLELLKVDSSDFDLEEAVSLLCKLINVFPSSVCRHYDDVESSIFSKFMSENGSINLYKKLGHCLVMLPKSRGDEGSWLLMMQKLILFLNNQLTFAFQGLEEETTGNEIVRLLVPPGKDPPPLLGGLKNLEPSIERPEQVLVSRVSILMSCCGMMLTNSYPVQVLVPVRPLIALIKRVLMVDGSTSPSSHLMTITRHEFICAELPTLHVCSLDLLNAIVKGLRSQLLPHVAGIIRLLTYYIGTCSLPEPRIKVYSVLKLMLLSMGIGMAIHLVDVVINNTFVDLDSFVHDSKVDGIQKISHKKRKHAASTGLLEEEAPMVMERSQKLAPITVSIAALEVLEALLTVAGALRSGCWRSKVDLLLMKVASNACNVGFTDDIGSTVIGEATLIWQDLQLSALRALFASLLSTGRVRPPHLAQSQELFRKGTQERRTNIAEYCQYALLALEVLIHPRALPVGDFQTFGNHLDDIYSSNHEKKTPSLMQPSQKHFDDDLYKKWAVDGETEAGLGKKSRTNEEPSRTPENIPVGGTDAVAVDEDEEMMTESVSERGNLQLVEIDHGKGKNSFVAVDEDEMVIESVTERRNLQQLVEIDHNKGKNLLVGVTGNAAAESDRLVSGNAGVSLKPESTRDTDMEQALVQDIQDQTSTAVRDVIGSQYDGYDKIADRISAALSNAEKYARLSIAEKGKGADDEDDDYIPDIVDGDPDSDSE